MRAEGGVILGADGAMRAVSVDPADLTLADTDATIVHIAEQERERLRAQAADLGGRSALLHFSDAPDAGIEITKAHPGSLPQFITGRSTLLSGLFRDEVALGARRHVPGEIRWIPLEIRWLSLGITSPHHLAPAHPTFYLCILLASRIWHVMFRKTQTRLV